MQKKLLSILLVLCMLLGMFPMVLPVAAEETTVTEPTENTENTETTETETATVIEIGTADELIALMGDSSKWASDIKLTADIDLSTAAEGSVQAPIGNGTTAFTGTFDGQGNTISGINLAGSASCFGLFGIVSDDGDKTVITDLTIEGSVTSTANFAGGLVGVICGEAEISKVTSNLSTFSFGGTGRAAGLVGAIVNNNVLPAISTVENAAGGFTVKLSECVNNTAVTATGSADRIGGIVGSISPAASTRAGTTFIIEKCVNNADITSAKTRSGGIAGSVETGEAVGNTVTFTDCVNNGDVTGLGTNGGIVGYGETSKTVEGNALVVTKCSNYGTITGTQAVKTYLGGIMGYAQMLSSTSPATLTVSYCYNEGKVEATGSAKGNSSQIAGILGYTYLGSSATNCVLVQSCWNNGVVTSKGQDIAGIIGTANPAKVFDCLNTGAISSTADGSVGGIVARSAGTNNFSRNYNAGTVTATGTHHQAFGKPSAATTMEANFYSAGSSSADGDTNATYVAPASVAVASYFTGLNAEGEWLFTDMGPEIEYFHVHDVDAKYVAVDGGHVTACYCNDAATYGTEVAEHVMVDGACEECGYIACAHANTENQTTLEPTCTDVGFYSVYCNDCQTFVSQGNEIEIDPDAHYKGTHIVNDYDNSGCILYVYDCCGAVAFEDDAFATDIYVSTTGNDLTEVTDYVGDSAENAFANFTDAMVYAAASATVNGEATIHIVDDAIIPASYKTPAYEGMITITGGNINFNTFPRRWYSNGEVTFENLTFKTNANNGVKVYAQNHKMVMGEGIKMGNEGTLAGGSAYPTVNNVKMYLNGGFENNGSAEMATNLTVRSGDYWFIGGWNAVEDAAVTKSISAGTSTITIGKTNAEDYLYTRYLVGYSTGKQELSAASKATFFVDGEFGVELWYPGTQNDLAEDSTMLYETDIVLKMGGNFNNTVTETIGMANISGTLTTKNTKLTVYVDERDDNAVADALVFDAEATGSATIADMKTDYTKTTYVAYCAANYGHTDADENTLCDECGSSTTCDHANVTKEVITVGTCTTPGTYNMHCSDCGKYVYDEPQNETEYDANNHVDADGKTDTAWVANEDGTFNLVCNLCGGNVVEGAENAYVYFDPEQKYIMTTSDDALGTSAEAAVLTLVEAVDRLKTVGGKIIFVSALEVTSAGIKDLPAWENEITFTSPVSSTGYGTTGLRIMNHGAVINFNGPTKIEYLVINGSATAKNTSDYCYYNIPVFVANWNDFTVGEGVVAYGASYFVIGNVLTSSNVADNTVVDLATGVDENGTPVQKTVKVVLNRTAAKAVTSGSETLNAATATFDRVYLGTRNRTETAVTVKNVHIDFESVGATFNLVYAGSVSGGDHAFMENCSIKAVFGGNDAAGDPCDAYVRHFQVGQGNCNGSGTAYLDKLDVEFNGTAYMQATTSENHKDTDVIKTKGFSTRNVREVNVKISNGADRVYEYEASDGTLKTAEKYNAVTFYFSKSEGYVPTGAETVNVTYGTHSFLKGVNYPAYNAMYTVTENVTDECTWGDWELTTEATPEKPGVETATCSVCQRTKTQEVAYVCTAHSYVAKADGTYYCANNCGEVEAPEADAVIAVTPATVENGVATVNVVIDAASVWGAKFSVNAPEGFTLASATSTLGEVVEGANAFTFTGATELALPYGMAVINMATDDTNNLVNGTLDNVVVATLTFNVADTVEGGTYIVTVTADEVYTVDEVAVDTVVVAAEVAVPAEAACEHTNTTTTSTATCTEGGVETVTCDDCGEVVSTTEVAALGHTTLVEKEAAVAPTCTADGKTAVMGCERCDYTEGGEVDPATGHVNTTESTTAPTREADAVKTVTCDDCGEVVSTETIAPTDITIIFQHNVRFQAEYFLLFAAKHTDLANTTDRWAEFKTYNYDDNGNPVTNVTIVDPGTATATQKVFISPGISAKQMNDKIEVTYYAIANGVKYKSQVDTYNLVDYYWGQMGKGTYLEALLVEMLNYGAAAQKQLNNYNVTEVEGDRYTGLVNRHLAEGLAKNDLDAYADITTSVARNPHGDTTDMTYAFKANNGRFKQRISVLYAFSLLSGKTDIDMNNLVFKGTYTGLNDATNKDYVTKTIEIKGADGGFEKSGSMLVVVVDQISVKDLRATILNGALYDLEGNRVSETVDSGFESYVHGYTGSSATMKLLMKATLSYSDAAKTYFMNK